MMLFSGLSYSQVTVESLEKLEDGTIIVKVDNVSYRGLPPEKMREVLIAKETNSILEEGYDSLHKQFTDYRKVREEEVITMLEKHRLEREDITKKAVFYESEYTKENQLRVKYEKKLKNCTGKIIFFRLCLF